jgi:5S rRNA maturation endonuclease (ribonuclease M5)
MLQRARDIQEALEPILDDLKSLPPGTVILVEGSKDEAALRNLGIGSEIRHVHPSRSLPDKLSGFVEAVILTDYDRHGSYLAGRCERTARSFGVRPNLEFRRRIRKATFKELSHIEGLDAYVRNLDRRQMTR